VAEEVEEEVRRARREGDAGEKMAQSRARHGGRAHGRERERQRYAQREMSLEHAQQREGRSKVVSEFGDKSGRLVRLKDVSEATEKHSRTRGAVRTSDR
jgi:hypothetical protein